jgi:hypothetical protein
MASAWNATIDRNLGLFAADPPQTDPLTSNPNTILKPNPPYIGGHALWVKVSACFIRYVELDLKYNFHRVDSF